MPRQHAPRNGGQAADQTRVFASLAGNENTTSETGRASGESSLPTRTDNSLFVTPPAPRSETVGDDRSPTRGTDPQSSKTAMGTQSGGGNVPWSGFLGTQKGRDNYFPQAQTPSASFRGRNTNQENRAIPAPSVQATTAHGSSFLPRPIAGSQAVPALSRIAGHQTTHQDRTEQRRKAEEDEERTLLESMGM